MEQKTDTTTKTFPFAFDATPSMERMNAALDEMKKLQETQRKQAEAAIDEWAKLTKATLSYSAQMFEAWEKQAREATKKAFGGSV